MGESRSCSSETVTKVAGSATERAIFVAYSMERAPEDMLVDMCRLWPPLRSSAPKNTIYLDRLT